MSKILEATRRTTRRDEPVDFAFRLATVDGVSLFPAPPEPQRAEFEQLANTLLGLADAATGVVVTFASTVKGEGASYVSYNVARHLSYLLDRRVAWVDGNFRSPQERLLGHGVSFRALLAAPGLFSQVKTGGNLVLVPNGDEPCKPTDLLTSDSYVTLLEHFQRNFHLTIIDAPPLLDSVEVCHLAAPTLGLVLVVESRRLKHEIIRHGMEIAAGHKVRFIGSVLNRRRHDIPDFLYRRL